MSRLRTAIAAYPLVFATLIVAAIGLLLLATPASGIARWLVGGYALAIAAWEADPSSLAPLPPDAPPPRGFFCGEQVWGEGRIDPPPSHWPPPAITADPEG